MDAGMKVTHSGRADRARRGNALRSTTLWLASLYCLGLAGEPLAQTVYKTIGPDGTVSYSERPPADESTTEAVVLPAEPSAEELKDAELRREALDTSIEEMAKQRAALEAERQPPEPDSKWVDTRLLPGRTIIPPPLPREPAADTSE